jgi:hypothetical protein
MWKMSGLANDREEFREALLAMSAVAQKTAISLRNLRRILRSLEHKLAIEVIEFEDKDHSIPRRYRIWDFKSTIERRRKLGFHFVYRNRNLITLAAKLNPPDKLTGGAQDNMSGDPPGNLTSLAPDSLTGDPPDKQADTPPVSLSASLIKDSNKEQQANEPTTSGAIVAALHKTFGHSDDVAVSRVLSGCRRFCPDSTEEEIIQFIHEHGFRFVRMKNIDNPMGMLFWQVPRSFAADVERYRKAEEQRREAEAAQLTELRAQWQAVLDDPKASEDDKQWARQLLQQEEEKNA